jgi:hypothetical protein
MSPLLAEQETTAPLNVTLTGQNGKHCSAQVQKWALKMKIIPAISSYNGNSRLDNKG